MMLLLYIALGYLLITSGILYLNKQDFEALKPIPRKYFDEQAPEVNICIPARNEADSIERCVRSAANQQYPNYKVYVLDDNSTDSTTEILEELSNSFPRVLRVLSGKPKPKDWLGKAWACHQLSQRAEGDIFLFIDADTWLEPETTAKLVRTMGQDVIDFATLWPQQQLNTFWEKTVIPLVYFALLTLLPTRYVYQDPKWIPSFFRKKIRPLFAAACGQCMAFKSSAYRAIGGHESVKNNVVEDVALAKNIKRANYKMKMYHGKNAISCRMYSSANALWEGFRKNFLAGFGNIIPFFIRVGLVHIIAFLIPTISLPFLLLWGSPTTLGVCLTAVLIMLLQRFVIDRWYNWNSLYGLLHPIGIVWFQVLAFRVLSDDAYNEKAHWKGRNI